MCFPFFYLIFTSCFSFSCVFIVFFGFFSISLFCFHCFFIFQFCYIFAVFVYFVFFLNYFSLFFVCFMVPVGVPPLRASQIEFLQKKGGQTQTSVWPFFSSVFALLLFVFSSFLFLSIFSFFDLFYHFSCFNVLLWYCANPLGEPEPMGRIVQPQGRQFLL